MKVWVSCGAEPRTTSKPAPPGGRVTLQRALLEKLPMFVLAAAVAALTWSAQRDAGALSPLERLSLGARLRNAIESYVQYAAASFWPIGPRFSSQ